MSDSLIDLITWEDQINDISLRARIAQDIYGVLFYQWWSSDLNSWQNYPPPSLGYNRLLVKLITTLGYKKTPSGRWDVLSTGRHKYLLYYETVRELGPCTSRQVADHLGTTVMEANSFLRYLYGPRKRLITRWEPEGEPGAPYIYDLIDRPTKTLDDEV